MSVRATDHEFTEVWQANRPYLVNLAYGMLGDIGAAEDAVQDAFARFSTADRTPIQDARGWLIVVTSRICLDQIGSARVSGRPTRRRSSSRTWRGELLIRPIG